jgi:predicted  nucleic acid-binding Zn-ribbon protein
MEINSKPEELDRKVMQLEIEIEAIKERKTKLNSKL